MGFIFFLGLPGDSQKAGKRQILLNELFIVNNMMSPAFFIKLMLLSRDHEQYS